MPALNNLLKIRIAWEEDDNSVRDDMAEPDDCMS